MKVAIVGSRYYNDYDSFVIKVDNILHRYSRKSINIISGGCRGVDRLAERYARERNIKIKVIEAQWNKYGSRAGPIRNQVIVDMSHMVIAFVGIKSRGTINTISIAKSLNKRCIIINI